MARKHNFLRRKRSTTTSPRSTGIVRQPKSSCGVEPLFKVSIDPQVAAKFNAYAAAAFPREIGGLLRVVGDGREGYRVIDIQIFDHKIATGAYFELDGEEISRFLLDLVRSGRKSEVGEWRALIHSHPGFAPWPSGTDRDNLMLVAGDRFAFSIICSAYPQTERNYYLCHYGQGGATPLIVTGIVPTNDGELSGLGALSEAEIEEIREEVVRFLPAELTMTRSGSRLYPWHDDEDDGLLLFDDKQPDFAADDWQLGRDWQLPEPFAEDARFDD
jgi:proteasome lid subunit RPN8/RPN11